MNVDYPGVAKAELRRKRAGDERNAICKTRLEFLSESGNAFRQEHIVNAVLQVRVFAPDVKLTE